MLKKCVAAALCGLAISLGSMGYTYAASAVSGQLVKADEVLQAGTVIPATLLTPIVSDNMTTTIIAVVRQNVYDSVTGENLLVPAGSKLIGDPMTMAGKRIDISFNRIIFPNGHSVDLPDYRAVDGLGYSGLRDKYDTHSWLRFRSILVGAISAGAVSGFTYDDSDYSSDDDDTSASTEAKKGAISELLNGINDMVRQNNQNLAPTGTIREGFQFNVILNTDIRIKPYGG